MNALARLTELLNASGEVDYIDPLGDRHAVVKLYDGSRLLVMVEAAP